MLEDNYISRIPLTTKASIDRWVETACPVGGFLEAVLCNNLSEAIGRADEGNLVAIEAIVGYLYNECPGHCWGSLERYKTWPDKIREQKERSKSIGPMPLTGSGLRGMEEGKEQK